MVKDNRLIEAMKMKAQGEAKETPPELSKTEKELEFLRSQVTDLQERLRQKELSSNEQRLTQEAEALRQEEEALREEADLRKTLKDMLPERQSSSRSDDFTGENELSQKEMLAIMAEAVGKASEAQGKLILGEVSKLVQGTDDKINRTQKALVDMLAMADVSQTRADCPDFDLYKDDIKAIMGRTNLSSKEAYWVAKGQKESLSPPGSSESERPSLPPANAPFEPGAPSGEEAPRYPALRNPRQAFKNAAYEAIEQVIAQRGQKK